MTQTQLVGARPFALPAIPLELAGTTASMTAMAAAASWNAVIGYVINKDRGSKTLNGVAFRTGAITKAGGTSLDIDVQGVSATAGPPGQPDAASLSGGVVNISNANLTANTWHSTTGLTGNFPTPPTITHGQLIAIVFKPNTFGGADSLTTNHMNALMTTWGGQGATTANSGTTWTVAAFLPNIILEYSDGTFGTLTWAYPYKTFTATTLNNGSAPSELAVKFQLPVPCKVIGYWCMYGQNSANENFDIQIFDNAGPTTLANSKVSVDGNTGYNASGTNRFIQVFLTAELTLSANTIYNLAVNPTAATNLTLYYIDVAVAGHLQAHQGTNWTYAQRNGNPPAGAYTETTTRKFMAGLIVSSIDDGAGGGGGGAYMSFIGGAVGVP